MSKRKTERGQGMLELALILPVLLLLMLGVVEMGYALRNYLVVVNATREGGRFASRGGFTNQSILDRVIVSSGTVNVDGADMPFLRTQDPDPNIGIIITRIPMDSFGNFDSISVTHVISGVVPDSEGVRDIDLEKDTKVSETEITERHGAATASINDDRVAAGYERMDNTIVVVEVFYMHHPVLDLGIVPDPWLMYARTETRIAPAGERE